jgi:hypothetical protein
MDTLLQWNPQIAARINSSEAWATSHWGFKDMTSAQSHSHTSAAKVFSVFEGCGLFVPMGDFEKCYSL